MLTSTKVQLCNAAQSCGRVFAAAVLAVFLASGKAPSDLRVDDLVALLDAGLAAVALTGANALRTGERGFGRGADLEA